MFPVLTNLVDTELAPLAPNTGILEELSKSGASCCQCGEAIMRAIPLTEVRDDGIGIVGGIEVKIVATFPQRTGGVD